MGNPKINNYLTLNGKKRTSLFAEQKNCFFPTRQKRLFFGLHKVVSLIFANSIFRQTFVTSLASPKWAS
jgi:hypothetical protein